MANLVIKSDGSKVPFDPEKLRDSVKMACVDANCDEARTNEVTNKVSGALMALSDSKEEIATSELKTKALEELDREAPEAAAAWRKYVADKAAV